MPKILIVASSNPITSAIGTTLIAPHLADRKRRAITKKQRTNATAMDVKKPSRRDLKLMSVR